MASVPTRTVTQTKLTLCHFTRMLLVVCVPRHRLVELKMRRKNAPLLSYRISRMPSMEDLQLILERLSKNPDFHRLETQQQQLVVLQYAEQLKRQAFPADVTSASGFTWVDVAVVLATSLTDVLCFSGTRPR